jgi:hypothetical protein
LHGQPQEQATYGKEKSLWAGSCVSVKKGDGYSNTHKTHPVALEREVAIANRKHCYGKLLDMHRDFDPNVPVELVVQIEQAICFADHYGISNTVPFTLAFPPPETFHWRVMLTLNLNGWGPFLNSEFGSCFKPKALFVKKK